MRKIIDFFIFSSLFISCCAVLLVLQTNQLLHLNYKPFFYLLFVFFATLASYNFHWLLTPASSPEKQRTAWTKEHYKVHVVLLCIGIAGAFWMSLYLLQQWIFLGIAVGLTFLYSAPKIPHPFFTWLKKIAIGKTIFLAFVWTYVTSVLPVLLSGNGFNNLSLSFCISRFFLFYAVCIIFDYRDRDSDKKEKIRSMITYFTEKGIDRLFLFTLILFVITTMACGYYGLHFTVVLVLLIPTVFLAALYKKAKNNFSDYLYDFGLDSMLVLSSLITPFMQI